MEHFEFHYENFQDVLQLVTRFWLAKKKDIADAPRLIPLHPSQYCLTGFYFTGYYYERCLPMGVFQFLLYVHLKKILPLSNGPFTQNTKFLMWLKLSKIFCLWLVLKQDCHRSLYSFIHLCNSIRALIAHHKADGPTRRLTFIGIETDTEAMLALQSFTKEINRLA